MYQSVAVPIAVLIAGQLEECALNGGTYFEVCARSAIAVVVGDSDGDGDGRAEGWQGGRIGARGQG